MLENVDPVSGRNQTNKHGVRRCCCDNPKCGRVCNSHAHRVSSLKGDHRVKVVGILIPNDAAKRKKVLEKPESYRVHTSHFSESDKDTYDKGRVGIKAGALPQPMNDVVKWIQPGTSTPSPSQRGPINTHKNSATRPLPATPSCPVVARRTPMTDITNGSRAPRQMPCLLGTHNRRSPRASPPVPPFKRRLGMTARGLNTLARASDHALPRATQPTSAWRQPSRAVALAVVNTTPTQRRTPTIATPSPLPKDAVDPEIMRHMQLAIATLERRLLEAETLSKNKDVDLARAEEKLREAVLEKDVLQQQIAVARLPASRVDHLEKQIAERNMEIGRLVDNNVEKLTGDNICREGSTWNRCILQLSGISDADTLQALFNWLNYDGIADRMKYWNGSATINRIIAEAAGTTQRSSSGKPGKRPFTSKNAFLVTLVKLRTGLGTKVISSWSGIPASNLSRIFTTWVSHLDGVFNAQFPIPTTEDLQGRMSSEWAGVYGTTLVRFILDCTEYRTQHPCSRRAARTLWSDYKNCHTVKLLAATCPAGAYVGSTTAYPGRISDTEIFLESIFYQILQVGDCVPGDKGFDQLAIYFHQKGARLVAPSRRMKGRHDYTADERHGNEEQSNLRIHVERHFSRVKNWGVFSQKKLSLYSVDMIGKTFNVVSHLCNLQQSLCKSDSQLDDREEDGEEHDL